MAQNYQSASIIRCLHHLPQKKVEFIKEEQTFTKKWFTFFFETPDWILPSFRTLVWYWFWKNFQHQISFTCGCRFVPWTKDFGFCKRKKMCGPCNTTLLKSLPSVSERILDRINWQRKMTRCETSKVLVEVLKNEYLVFSFVIFCQLNPPISDPKTA